MASSEYRGVTPASFSYTSPTNSLATLLVSSFVNNDWQGCCRTPTSSLAQKTMHKPNDSQVPTIEEPETSVQSLDLSSFNFSHDCQGHFYINTSIVPNITTNYSTYYADLHHFPPPPSSSRSHQRIPIPSLTFGGGREFFPAGFQNGPPTPNHSDKDTKTFSIAATSSVLEVASSPVFQRRLGSLNEDPDRAINDTLFDAALSLCRDQWPPAERMNAPAYMSPSTSIQNNGTNITVAEEHFCPLCQVRFTQSQTLRRHLKDKHEDKMSCTHCLSFKWSRGRPHLYRRHLALKHPQFTPSEDRHGGARKLQVVARRWQSPIEELEPLPEGHLFHAQAY